MKKTKPTYQDLEKRLEEAEPIVEALKHQEVDAVLGEEKIAFLLLRKVEEACLESNGEFSALFNLDGIGMIQADAPAFRFTRVNPKFCEIAGYTSAELLTMTYIAITHPEDRSRGLKELARVIRGKTDSWSIEKRCIGKDEKVIWVRVHGCALRDHVGRAVRILAMLEDLTARKQAEQQQRIDEEHLKKQLQKQRAEMSRMLRSLHGQVARRKPTDQVLQAIQEISDRLIGPGGAKALADANKPIPHKKARLKKPKRTAGRKSDGKRRQK